MNFNSQVFQSVICRFFLQRLSVRFLRVLYAFKDTQQSFFRIQLRRQFFAGIFLGSLSLQIVFAQGQNPNATLLMQGLAASGGQVNPATVNGLGVNALPNLKTPLPDLPELNLNQLKKTKDEEAKLLRNKEPIPLNTFQTYLLQTIGKSLPIYGQKMFQLDNSYGTIETNNIPADYVLGPGDELQVKIYSSAIDLDQRFIINRDGMIVLPKLGPLSMAGVRVSDIENRLKAARDGKVI